MKAQSSRIVKDHHIIHRNAWSVNGRIQQEWHIEHLGFQKERRCHLNLNNIVNNNKYLSMISDFLLVVCSTYTPIPAMAYYINDLSIQLCGRGQPISKLGESFTKYVHHTMPIFEKEIHPTSPVTPPQLWNRWAHPCHTSEYQIYVVWLVWANYCPRVCIVYRDKKPKFYKGAIHKPRSYFFRILTPSPLTWPLLFNSCYVMVYWRTPSPN